MYKRFSGTVPNILLFFLLLAIILVFSPPPFANAGVVFIVGVIAAVVDYQSCDLNVVWGCGGGGGNGGGGGGGGGSCGEGEQLCAGSCIPADADCCARLGFSAYCPTQDGVRTYCSSDGGRCRLTPCTDNSNQVCASPANSCGQTSSARYNCDGVCNAGTPPDSSCPTPTITISARGPGGSQFVNRGSACTIRWSSTDATSCTLTGPGLSVTGTSGQVDTPPLQNTSTYSLSCRNGTVVTASKEVICYLTPHFEEF